MFPEIVQIYFAFSIPFEAVPHKFSTSQEQDGVAVPCFLKDLLVPLFRAGQQLQVLKKLLEICNYVATDDHTYEDILPCWRGFSSNHPSCASLLTFNKGNIEAMVLARNHFYERMQQKLENLSTKLETRYRQVINLQQSSFLSIIMNPYFSNIESKIWC